MTSIRTAIARSRDGSRSEQGFSLIETLVAASIFAVFLGVAMSAIIAMLTSSQKTQSLTDGAATLDNVFQKLDHQVRYANGISNPGTNAAGNWFVEWQSQPTSTAPYICTQLKYNVAAGTLLERTWQPKASPVVASPWQQIANKLVYKYGSAPTYLATAPFVFTGTSYVPTDASKTLYAHQQLRVFLTAQPNGTTASKSTVSQADARFTALNSTTNTGIVCAEVART
jgi:prepilin-type N-terminal cleavage/methylation domain-containing protein